MSSICHKTTYEIHVHAYIVAKKQANKIKSQNKKVSSVLQVIRHETWEPCLTPICYFPKNLKISSLDTWLIETLKQPI